MKIRRTTLIFTHGGGRFANQISNLAHLYAFYLEHSSRVRLMDMAFWNYRQQFLNPDRFLAFGERSVFTSFLYRVHDVLGHIGARAQQALYLMLHLCGSVLFQSVRAGSAKPSYAGIVRDKIDFSDDNDVEFLLKPRITFLSGWTARSWDLVARHQQAIRNILQLKPEYRQAAQKFTRDLRDKYDFLVVVQIRQGDYRDYEGGCFFYQSKQYIEWANQIKSVFSSKGKVAIIVTSDEVQDRAQFAQKDIFWGLGQPNGSGHYLEDFATLSLCDLIVSPPSTFAAWAGFLGRVPWLPLISSSQKITQDDILQDAIFDGVKHPIVMRTIAQ